MEKQKIGKFFFDNFKKHIHLKGYNYLMYAVEKYDFDNMNIGEFCEEAAEHFSTSSVAYQEALRRVMRKVSSYDNPVTLIRCIQEEIKFGIERSEYYAK